MAFPFQFDTQMKIFIGNVKFYIPEFCFFKFLRQKRGGGSEAKNQISRALTIWEFLFIKTKLKNIPLNENVWAMHLDRKPSQSLLTLNESATKSKEWMYTKSLVTKKVFHSHLQNLKITHIHLKLFLSFTIVTTMFRTFKKVRVLCHLT